jgi:hypothetical protein
LKNHKQPQNNESIRRTAWTAVIAILIPLGPLIWWLHHAPSRQPEEYPISNHAAFAAPRPIRYETTIRPIDQELRWFAVKTYILAITGSGHGLTANGRSANIITLVHTDTVRAYDTGFIRRLLHSRLDARDRGDSYIMENLPDAALFCFTQNCLQDSVSVTLPEHAFIHADRPISIDSSFFNDSETVSWRRPVLKSTDFEFQTGLLWAGPFARAFRGVDSLPRFVQVLGGLLVGLVCVVASGVPGKVLDRIRTPRAST